MRKSMWSLIFTLVFAIMSVYFLKPTYDVYKVSPQERNDLIKDNPDLRNKVLNLGLDLTGGMRLLLEVERNASNQDDPYLLDRAYTVIENRVNGSGISEAVVQKQGNNRLVIELPGINDEDMARNMIGSEAQLQFHVVRHPEDLEKALGALDKSLRQIDKSKVEATSNVIASSNDSTTTDSLTQSDSAITAHDTTQPSVDSINDSASTSDDALLADLGLSDENINEDGTVDTTLQEQSPLERYLIPAPRFGTFMVAKENRKEVQDLLQDSVVQAALRRVGLGQSTFMLGATLELDESTQKEGYLLYLVKTKPAMSGKEVTAAHPGVDQQKGGNNVSLSFSNAGAKEFHKVTARNVGERLAIVLDGAVYSAPSINEPIAHGNASISGNFTYQEANNLAVVLQAGAMPAPVKIIDVRTVGPTLGKESIDKAAIAAIIGFGLVLAFMLYYYQLSGLIAIAALGLNIIFVLAIMAGAGATLTLPGIAGLILIMGMSVDANVITFERIKEELLLGKGVATAIDAGYDRAFVTIMDANITTLATAWILYEVGTGAIRGFAVTMGIGIIVSLFTALVFTKMIFHIITEKIAIKNLSIFPMGSKGKNS